MTLQCTTNGDLVAIVCWCHWLLAGPQLWLFRCSVIRYAHHLVPRRWSPFL